MSYLKKIALLGAAVGIVAGGAFLVRRGMGPSPESSPGPDIKLEKALEVENIVPFLVLGSGPASLAAALYGARTQIRTVVIKGNKPGGALTGTSYIENWPGISRKIRGPEVMQDFEEQAHQFGAIMVSDSATKVDLSQWPYVVETEEGRTLKAMALFVGTGATPRYLGVPGEEQYWGKGVTTCAICDAPYHRGDEVIVVGGGDSAVEEALELSPYAKRVRVLVRGDEMRASAVMISKLQECTNVEVVFNSSVVKINGDGEHVVSVDVINNKTKNIENWPKVKGVFLGIGHLPNTKLFNGAIKTNKEGYIVIEGRQQGTSVPGVFAAGDVSDPRYRQAGVAAGDGIKAGLDALWWLTDIGYNANVAQKMEPYFFENDSKSDSLKIDQVDSLEEFDAFMKETKEEVVIVDFLSPTCPSCMHMLPAIQWVGAKLVNKIKFVKVDTSVAFDLVKKFKIPQIPYLLILKNGQKVDDRQEALDRAELYTFIKKHI